MKSGHDVKVKYKKLCCRYSENDLEGDCDGTDGCQGYERPQDAPSNFVNPHCANLCWQTGLLCTTASSIDYCLGEEPRLRVDRKKFGEGTIYAIDELQIDGETIYKEGEQ